MAEAILALGSNLGARRAIFGTALAMLDALPGCAVLARSRLYETPPLGPPQPAYLNAAVRVRWDREPLALLRVTQHIEQCLGRERRVRWGPRTLDIDMLHWSEGAIAEPGLAVPHTELEQRAFALAPLLDVASAASDGWHQALARLGGAPPLASPGWVTPLRESSFVSTAWLRDEGELLSQLGDVLARHIAGELPGNEVRASSTRTFSGPAELLDAHGQSWLEGALLQALEQGFRVRRCAVVTRLPTEFRGVFVGAQQRETPLGPRYRAPLELRLEQRSEGERRVQVRTDVADDGFEFAGSVTM
jgi:2-amino-4-hydroxy-6-hydroxymethyldihydropteridine diphosphokinase